MIGADVGRVPLVRIARQAVDAARPALAWARLRSRLKR
jgi:hypothetical protein